MICSHTHNSKTSANYSFQQPSSQLFISRNSATILLKAQLRPLNFHLTWFGIKTTWLSLNLVTTSKHQHSPTLKSLTPASLDFENLVTF
ncbi:hypothetical protein L3X38_001888 [Prunus dulcis]|uniref:Uncharacterized protein n=1 Tax=Prunus dulcis TaxID=3755 RepID=A0AAD4WTI6_PRUDU|nr:hypothetical protein L3X38_001888 [Prunus dulcis]